MPSQRSPRKLAQASSRSVSNSTPWGSICVAFLIGAVVMRAWDSTGRGVPPPSPAPAPYEVVDVNPAPQPNNSINLKEHYLVVVLQRKSMPVEYTLTMDDYEFWNVWIKANMKSPYIELQPGTEDAKQFEDAARMPAPFVMLVPARGPPVWTIPLPKGSADAVKAKLGAK